MEGGSPLDLLCPEHGKFLSSGLSQSVSEEADSGVPATQTAFPNNLCSFLLACTGCVLLLPNTGLESSELAPGLLPLCSSFQGVPPLGETPGKEMKCGSMVGEVGEKRVKGWNSVWRLRRCPGRSALCFPRVLLRFRFRQWNGGLVKIVSCPCGFIAAVISAPLSKVGSLFYLSLQEVDF